MNWSSYLAAFAVRDLGLRDATDEEIFAASRRDNNVVVMTKDRDFIDLVNRLGSPPKVLWLTAAIPQMSV